jgi:hypothetical protein
LPRAEVKVLQLAEASKAGLKTPHTLISNDPAKAAAFVDALGEVECAIKPLIALDVSNEQGYRFPLTTTLPKGHADVATGISGYHQKVSRMRCSLSHAV